MHGRDNSSFFFLLTPTVTSKGWKHKRSNNIMVEESHIRAPAGLPKYFASFKSNSRPTAKKKFLSVPCSRQIHMIKVLLLQLTPCKEKVKGFEGINMPHP
ncbi:hypothetical protein OPV22_007488 [Ensete ventricosum]|uniref:Uncharacterized protein n=1 Tax=Ensete ventricosum TaxID=4639 RepID=A0AAV8QEI3_ENSVE|nr:hypothetical protein OPV22_007488 [Ensete ventricosum]